MAKSKKSIALVLRTCKSDLTSRNGFQWADVGGTTTAPDWVNNKDCGNGLHGWLFGAGDHSCSNYLDAESKWMVLEVELKTIVMLGEKCKFPSAKTVFVGDKKSATDYLIANEPRAKNVAVIGASLEVGDNGAVLVGNLGTATAGNWGTATAGESGTATAGESGTATAGYKGTATAGNWGTATAGYKGTATAGYKGTATAGNWGTATAGNWGTATAGESGTATAGNWGTATAGYKGTATAGYKGTATAGYKGEIRIQYWDSKAERYRTEIGYIGEDGLKANTAYKLDDNHKFVEVEGE
ncbi:hypothetical protein DLK06_04550 [Acinetobacter pittii]|uniref:DUF7666 domain-containing protein n=1 Tax=Acinetobacter pittii TaxID=48296 RepID=A0AAE9MB44_ACIPI|nr:hypothetical protein [Acinetobacter pittii]AZP28402.1 hypothetical protein DLK06_04550 [Acinetobacter pittii]USU95535.1 hypothetical protein MWH18_04535 [Acinetobacter pittii]